MINHLGSVSKNNGYSVNSSKVANQKFRGADTGKESAPSSTLNKAKEKAELRKELKDFFVEAFTTLGMVFSELLSIIIFPIYMWKKLRPKETNSKPSIGN